MFGPPVGLSGQVSACSVHHQYSSRLSPFQAKTGMPRGSSGVPSGPTAIAAAAWSWVEKMLHEAQRTRAPRAARVSMRTAVCTVMCREPVIRAPARGCASAYSLRIAIRPGISCSARVISLRPNSARERSATLKSCRLSTVVIANCSSGSGRGGYGWSARRGECPSAALSASGPGADRSARPRRPDRRARPNRPNRRTRPRLPDGGDAVLSLASGDGRRVSPGEGPCRRGSASPASRRARAGRPPGRTAPSAAAGAGRASPRPTGAPGAH